MTDRVRFPGVVSGTPVFPYRCGPTTVLVKRDDLAGDYPAPPLGKLRALAAQLSAVYRSGMTVGVVDRSPGSRNSWAVAYLANRLGVCCVAYGTAIGPYQGEAVSLGAEYRLVPIGSPEAVYAHAEAEFAAEPDGWMSADDCQPPELIRDMRAEATWTPLDGRTVVIPTGSGGTAAGILLGVAASGARPRRVVLHLSGSRRTSEYVLGVLRTAGVSQQVLDVTETTTETGRPAVPPFPANPKYEVPAWTWLVEEMARRPEDGVLFWNAGG